MDEELRKLREDAAMDLSPSSPAVVQVSSLPLCVDAGVFSAALACACATRCF